MTQKLECSGIMGLCPAADCRLRGRGRWAKEGDQFYFAFTLLACDSSPRAIVNLLRAITGKQIETEP